MVFLEAAACGKPAVAGIAGGTGSAVIEGMTGLRVDGNAVVEIFGALDELLGDEAKRHDLGQGGFVRARDLMSWAAVAEKTRAIHLSLGR